jgi:4-amino-4-deoxy-L-arabinose transferase-like glycosyltransferase
MPGTDVRRASTTNWLGRLVCLSVVLRVAAALYLGNDVTVQPGTADQLSYHLLALRVLGGYGFSFETGWWPATPAGEPTAHWSYLYVLFLASIYQIVGPAPLVARIVQAIAVGVLQPVLTYAITRRLFGARVGLIAAAVVAGYAYFIYYAGALMTESFFIVALLWSIDAATRLGHPALPGVRTGRSRAWVTLGVALATAILLRQAFMVCVPVILLWVCWRRLAAAHPAPASRGLEVRSLARGLGLTLMVIALAVLPWTVRNYRVFHQFVLLNTNAGFAFFWGNHPIHGRNFVPILPGNGSLYGELIPGDIRGLNEAEADRALLGRGLGFVAEDPVRYAFLAVSRVREFVKFWPSPDSGRLSNAARVVSFGLCAPFMVAGLALLMRDRSCRQARANAWLILGVALVYSLAHVLTWTLVRYRLPVDALLLPVAALAMQRGFDRLASRARPATRDALAT